jgi:hypothetical protein
MLITNFNARGKIGGILSLAAKRASSIWIVTAYMSPGGCGKLSLPSLAAAKPVHVTIGRAMEEGLPRSTHSFACALDGIAATRGGGVRGGDPPSHSKIYAFEMPGRQIAAWVGSSNLTEHGLGDWREANVAIANPAVARAILREAQSAWASGILISSAMIVKAPAGVRRIWKRTKPQEFIESITEEPNTAGGPVLCLSLLAKNGEVQNKAGLNWWNAVARAPGSPRDPDEAYVALPSAAVTQASRVFGTATRGTDFQAIMHDGTKMPMKLFGSSVKGARIPKQIGSRGNDRVFGEWILRKILRLRPGTLVTRALLERYGRTEICFHRIGTDPATGQAIVFVDFRP